MASTATVYFKCPGCDHLGSQKIMMRKDLLDLSFNCFLVSCTYCELYYTVQIAKKPNCKDCGLILFCLGHLKTQILDELTEIGIGQWRVIDDNSI